MKAWALILVVALSMYGWVGTAGAAKIQLTDQEMDAVGAGDSAAAASQAGLGSATAGAFSVGFDAIAFFDTAAAVVTNSGSAAAAASATNTNTDTTASAGNHTAKAGGAAGTNAAGAGNGGTKFEKLKAEFTTGIVQLSCILALCALVLGKKFP